MKRKIYSAISGLARVVKKLDTSTDIGLYKTLYHNESIEKRKFYNVGAGYFVHPCWTNIDDGSAYYESINDKAKTRIIHDLFAREPFPCDENELEVVYTSHTLEHLDNDSVKFFLSDSRRVLKPGGTLRIVVPNIEQSFRAWKANDRNYFYWTEWEQLNKGFKKYGLKYPLRDATLSQIFLEDFAAAASEITEDGCEKRIGDAELAHIFESMPMEQALDYCISYCSVEMQKAYPFRHMNWYNEKKLHTFLEEAGFKSIYRSGYLQSAVPVLRNVKYFDNTMPPISLYMEARK